MKKSTFTETQILNLLKEFDSGRDVVGICREHGISKATFYNWRKKYSGMESQKLKRLKDLEIENARLKKLYADLSLDHAMLKDILTKKF
ncbi:transposase IS3/IS911 family protein [Chitinophaga pinensis DSM 2588]|uniref:Transposase IS3/IS911 family protein n=1 Tax=Chitinophaga pinensis (strain ATCC 43595 / DSM 2588 / LMG 13176 / NBRC 15968 / NCIMB 11800 / UQM 2034) TaxID=485918 RepID=A0A979GMQ9_CHIPD|nr:transposase IS3/IS911 family protein [Chitinophaga pinensis DSM 2588]